MAENITLYHNNVLRHSLCCTSAIALALQPVLACSLPMGGTLSAGQASVASTSQQVIVNQTSPRAVIDWNSFNVGQNENVQFKDPSASAITLNRIHDSRSSFIDGQLFANGNVWLINPNGIAFGKDTQVNVGGLLASTSAIANSDFMAGNYRFTPGGNAGGQVTNAGSITVADTGLVTMVAPQVINSGAITARLGKVQMGAGDSFTLDLYGDGLINLAASPTVISELAANQGTISADGGTVSLTAAAASNIVNSLINMDGLIEADSVKGNIGSVSLKGAKTTEVSGTIHASGGQVETSGESLSVSGTVVAKDWLLDPNNVIIQSGGSDTNVSGNPNFTTTNDSAIVTTSSVDAALNAGTSVTVQTGSAGTNSQSGDIEVASSISKTSGGDASLTLEAYRNITLDNNVQVGSTSGKLTVTLDANAANAGSGAILLNPGSGITSNGGNIVLGGGANPLTGSAINPNGDGIELGNNNILQAGGGNITLNGTSQNNMSDVAIGVVGWASFFETSGTGTITINGTGGNTAGNGTVTSSYGVYLTSSGVRSDAGLITINGTGGNSGPSSSVGIFQNGGDISSVTGGISLTGQGGNNSQQSWGILLGQGVIASTGTVNGATTKLDGRAGSGPSANLGIELEFRENVSSVTGDIGITGHGGDGSNYSDYGVAIDRNAIVQSVGMGSDAAKITIIGASGSGSGSNTGGFGNPGIQILDGSVSSVDGDISLTGQGGGTGSGEYGVSLAGGAKIQGTGNANILFTGTGANGAADISALVNGDIANSVSATRGNITFNANSLDCLSSLDPLSPAANINISTSGNVSFVPRTSGASIGVAGGVGDLILDNHVLGEITQGNIIIGSSSDAGSMNIGAHAWNGNVTFLNGSGDFVLSGAQTTPANDSIIFSTTGNFENVAGSGALMAGAGGRYLIYSSPLASNLFDNIPFDFVINGCTYSMSCPSLPANGNGLILSESSVVVSKITAATLPRTVVDTPFWIVPSQSYDIRVIWLNSTDEWKPIDVTFDYNGQDIVKMFEQEGISLGDLVR
jgi:filamentous hemagglutinin family protein